MVNFENKPCYGVYDLERLIKILRSPGGCPWDAEQTHESIRRNILEEAYEAAEAIDESDPEHLKEELGDVLTQVVFHAGIEQDAGRFTLDDVADAVCRKLIYRHPHVFGDGSASNSGEVLDAWDKLKRAEKSHETVTDALSAVARSLPALWRAEKVQRKAAKAGFDWEDVSGALEALGSEALELRQAIESGGDVAGELGDVLFSAVNAARFLDVDPEEALTGATDKFIRRFKRVEELAGELGEELSDMSPSRMDELYRQAKSDLEKI